MKIMTCHPGHAFSTVDVFTGLNAGLRANDCEVVTFDWAQVVQTFTALVVGAAAGGVLSEKQIEQAHAFCSWVAAADATNIALTENVDAIVVVNGLLFPPSRVAALRCLGVPVVCVGTESPYFDATEQQVAVFYDHWFTNERASVARFRQNNPQSHYLPMAWNPDVHRPGEKAADKAVDLVFVGGGFPERKALLKGIDWAGIEHRVLGTLWHLDAEQEIGARDFLRGNRYTDGAIPNEETSAWHRSAKVALNLHRRMTTVESGKPLPPGVVTESLGPRAYEIPAVGGFMLCDDERPEIFDVFGDYAVTFRAWDSADMERTLRYWLTHEDRRLETARAQHEAVQAHSWTQRARTILETIL